MNLNHDSPAPGSQPAGAPASPPLDAAPSPARPRPQMSVHPIASVFFGAYVVAVVIASSARSEASVARVIGEVVGAVGAMSLIVLVLSYLAWLVSRRSRLVPTLVVSMLFSLASLGAIGQAIQAGRSSRAMEQLQQDQDHLLDRIEQNLATQLASGDLSIGGAEMLEEMVDRMERASRDVSSREREVLQAMASTLSDMAPILGDYEAALDAFTRAGASDPATITTREQLAERRVMIQDLRHANDRFIDFCDSVETNLVRRLAQASSLTDSERRQLRQLLIANMDLDLLREVRVEDDRILNASLGLLAVLDHEWGRWALDPASGMVLFDEDAPIAKFNQHFDVLTAAADRQAQLQQQLLDRLRARRGATP